MVEITFVANARVYKIALTKTCLILPAVLPTFFQLIKVDNFIYTTRSRSRAAFLSRDNSSGLGVGECKGVGFEFSAGFGVIRTVDDFVGSVYVNQLTNEVFCRKTFSYSIYCIFRINLNLKVASFSS